MFFQVQAIDYSADAVKVTSSNGSQWTAQKVAHLLWNRIVSMATRQVCFNVDCRPPGPRYGPADSASEERHPLQPAASWTEAEGNPQSGSGNHRKGHERFLSRDMQQISFNVLNKNNMRKYKNLFLNDDLIC